MLGRVIGFLFVHFSYLFKLIDSVEFRWYYSYVQVSLFFTESPTNPFLRCVDIKLVSELCHKHGALLCIDGTFATPLNQKALALGADLIMHSCTKYMGGHHDVRQSVFLFFKISLIKQNTYFTSGIRSFEPKNISFWFRSLVDA